MTHLFRQYRTEARNILLIGLLIAVSPYLPQVLAFLQTFTGIMLLMALVTGYILGMSLKVYYRIVVMRIRREEQQ